MVAECSTTTIIYENCGAIVICSLKLTQRTGTDPSVLITSPQNILRSSLVKLDSPTTKHHFLVQSVRGGSYVDYVNSIAMCVLKARVPCDVLVGAMEGESILVYSPQQEKVEYFCGSGDTMLDRLRDKCIARYRKIQDDVDVLAAKEVVSCN